MQNLSKRPEKAQISNFKLFFILLIPLSFFAQIGFNLEFDMSRVKGEIYKNPTNIDFNLWSGKVHIEPSKPLDKEDLSSN